CITGFNPTGTGGALVTENAFISGLNSGSITLASGTQAIKGGTSVAWCVMKGLARVSVVVQSGSCPGGYHSVSGLGNKQIISAPYAVLVGVDSGTAATSGEANVVTIPSGNTVCILTS